MDKAVQRWLQHAMLKNRPQIQELMQQKVYEGYQHRIVVKDNGLIRIIPAQDIYYIEANDDYIKIVTKDGSYLKKSTLSHIEQSLDPEHFVRIHRSYMIPVSQLVRIEPYEKESHIALLQCGAKVTVSKNGMAKLKTLLGW
ncbi:MAG: LytTR family DNA-binding domain-containing protein [Bacteroidota bacterium]